MLGTMEPPLMQLSVNGKNILCDTNYHYLSNTYYKLPILKFLIGRYLCET